MGPISPTGKTSPKELKQLLEVNSPSFPPRPLTLRVGTDATLLLGLLLTEVSRRFLSRYPDTELKFGFDFSYWADRL